MRVGTCSVLCAMLASPVGPGALAQTKEHHHELHSDYYRHWQRPDVGGSCCNARLMKDGHEVGDCEPTTAEFRGDRWFAWLRGQRRWIEIPNQAILRETNPNPEQAHLCFAYERVLCFLPPFSGG